jgi:signal transduction histidine kinase
MNSDNNHEKMSTGIILAQLKEIAAAVMYAAEGTSLQQVLERIAQVSKDLVKVRFSALGVPDGRGGLRYFEVAGMTPEERAVMSRLPTGRGLLGSIMTDRKNLRLERMQDDPRSAGFCKAHPIMTSLLGVPIQIGKQLFGILYLCDREDGLPFTQEDEWVVETLAGYAALAIAGSQLREQQNRLTLMEERERIGMELHDGVIQSLYAIGMHLDLMRMNGGGGENELMVTIHSLNDVIEDIRRYIMNLHSSDMHQKTVYERLQDMLSRLHTPDNLNITLAATHDKPLFTPATFEAICQMANEAISNAVRHAEATSITVSTEEANNWFGIVIADNGKGFDASAIASHNGLGLRNLYQRAALHGGQVAVDSEPGKGTRVSIRIPIRMV